jgi:hypothetical protein
MHECSRASLIYPFKLPVAHFIGWKFELSLGIMSLGTKGTKGHAGFEQSDFSFLLS